MNRKDSDRESKKVMMIWSVLSRQQRVLGVVLFLASLIGAFLEMMGVSVIAPLVMLVMNPSDINISWAERIITNVTNVHGTEQLVVFFSIGVIVLYFIKNMYFVFLSWLRMKYSYKIIREFSLEVMHSYLWRSYDEVARESAADAMRVITNDTIGVQIAIYNFLRLLVESVTILLIVIYVFVATWKLAVCMLLISACCLFLIIFFFRKKMISAGRSSMVATADLNRIIMEVFYGMKEVFVMRRQAYFERRYEKAFFRKQAAEISRTLAQEVPAYIIELFFVSGIMGYIAILALLAENISALLPVLASVAVGAFRILPALGRLSNAFNQVVFYMPSVQSVVETINMLQSKKDKEVDISPVESKEQMRDILLSRSLQIIDVFWKYPQSSEYVLRGCTLCVGKGESIGVMGSSGAGKSTLIDIILGLHSPDLGEVLIDGIDIKTIPDAWSRVVGYVPQTTYLIEGTIKGNVAFGIEDSEVDDDLVWDSLKQAQLEQFVKGLPDGLDTNIGERGMNLSGGQRQRLSIARALYRKPQLLVMDEATSALDDRTENALMEAIEYLHGSITMIIVAHRKSTLRGCDRIYEISQGKIKQLEWNNS